MFTETPRYVGFPSQVYAENDFAFKNFENVFKNKAPFFVSTFKFKDKDTPIVDNLFFDIDSYFSLRVPWRNVKLIKDWCYKKDIPYVTNFSGGKGFHFYMLTKPIVPVSFATQEKIRNMMYSIQISLAKEVGIEAYDEPTFGRLRFLMRYPTSKYIRKDEDTGAFAENGFYCRNLTDEEFDAGIKKISVLVKEPGVVPKVPKSDFSLQDIANLIPKFRCVNRTVSQGGGDVTDKMYLMRAGMSVPPIEGLGLPCLKELATHSHPTHFERVELVAWMKLLGYTDLAIIQFIKQRNWTRFKYGVTQYQVKTVFSRFPKCTFLRKSYGNLCTGCPLKGGKQNDGMGK